MVGPAAAAVRHEALFYRDDDEFVTQVTAYLREGLEADDAVIVVEPTSHLDMLREALGADSADVQWIDMVDVGPNPARLIPFWLDLVAGPANSGRPIRGVGEPAFVGRRALELVECEVHEALVDTAFTTGSPGQLLCPYDRRLPPEVQAGALRTHAAWRDAEGRRVSHTYVPPGDGLDLATLPACAPLSPPSDVVLRGEFGLRDVPAVRRTVRIWAGACELPTQEVENLELAASELASNCIRHGGGGGSLAMWREPDAVVVEFSCPGRIADPLAGRRRPDPLAGGGMGLYLVQQLCDLVQIRTGPAGTTVRVLTWTPPAS